ncbi:hypothetical protein [Actinoplanes sp. NPDC089786]|uniref:hypothetical protein n=1 Tax=Actinoplanes sp. NPDC089786 TaxID=3155185 RepID=UPI003431ED43
MPRKHSRRVVAGLTLAALLPAGQGCGTAAPLEAPGSPAPSAATAPSAASPSPSPTAAPDPKLAAILAGKRKIIIHLIPADRDLSATYEGPIATGDGTDDGALFRILPAKNGRHLVEALRAREEGGRWCAAVQTEDNLTTLTTVECQEAAETTFTIEATGAVDDKKRPAHRIVNDDYGTVRWKPAGQVLFLDKAGDSPATFSFVDRGAA